MCLRRVPLVLMKINSKLRATSPCFSQLNDNTVFLGGVKALWVQVGLGAYCLAGGKVLAVS